MRSRLSRVSLLLLVLFLLPLSGCATLRTQRREVEQLRIIQTVGVDYAPGGVRLTLLCGLDALDDYRRRQEEAAAVSHLLSVPKERIAEAVERQLAAQERQKERIASLSLALCEKMAEAEPETDGNIVLFDSLLDEVALRELVNRLTEKCRVAAVFSEAEGGGWRYIIGSKSVDLRTAAKELNAGVNGRGGGSPTMIRGSAAASREMIRIFMKKFKSLDTADQNV